MGSKGAFWPWLILLFLIAGGFAYLFAGGYLGLPQPSLPRLFGARPNAVIITPDGQSLQVGADGRLIAEDRGAQTTQTQDPSKGEVKLPKMLISMVRPLLVQRVLSDLEAEGYADVDRRWDAGNGEILLVKQEQKFVLKFEQDGEYLRWFTKPAGTW